MIIEIKSAYAPDQKIETTAVVQYENCHGATSCFLNNGKHLMFNKPTYEEFDKIMHRKKVDIDFGWIALLVFTIIITILNL